MASKPYVVTITEGNSLSQTVTREGEVYRGSVLLDGDGYTALVANLDASVNATLSADGIFCINQLRTLDLAAPAHWDATNKETVGDLLETLNAGAIAADPKAGLSDLTTMLQSEDASFTPTLQTGFKDLMLLTEADGLAADDIEIITDILAARVAADASWGTEGKDAVKRLVNLIIADADISTVISAIAALE